MVYADKLKNLQFKREKLKIQEKYLFKEIEIFITLKNFDSTTIKEGA